MRFVMIYSISLTTAPELTAHVPLANAYTAIRMYPDLPRPRRETEERSELLQTKSSFHCQLFIIQRIMLITLLLFQVNNSSGAPSHLMHGNLTIA